jgi:hypothetical protein
MQKIFQSQLFFFFQNNQANFQQKYGPGPQFTPNPQQNKGMLQLHPYRPLVLPSTGTQETVPTGTCML